MTSPLQQVNTQRMRLKIRSNPREDEEGQQPITSMTVLSVVLTIGNEKVKYLFPFFLGQT